MAIKKEPRINKFDSAVAELNEQEEHAREISDKVVKSIDDTEVGSKINVRLKDGILETVVESVTGVDVN